MLETLRDYVDLRALATRFAEFLPNLGVAFLLFILFLVLFRLSRRPLRGMLKRAHFHEKLIELLVDKLYRYALVLMGLVMALAQVGVDVRAALAGIGIAGIAIGFAAQDSVANVISGIMIFWDKPFIVGDWIEVEDEYGKVTDITLRSTRIRTPRNTFVVIPNKNIIDSLLENFSKRGELRVDVPMGIAYKEDIREARRVLLGAVSDLPFVRPEPPPDVIVDSLGDSSVNLKVRVWIDTPDHQQPVFFRVLETAKIALDDAGIQIPYPHLQLFWDDVEQPVLEKLSRLPVMSRGERPSGGDASGRGSTPV